MARHWRAARLASIIRVTLAAAAVAAAAGLAFSLGCDGSPPASRLADGARRMPLNGGE